MVADPENPLVLNVLHASSTAYSFNPDDPVRYVIGVIVFTHMNHLESWFLPLLAAHTEFVNCKKEAGAERI